MYVCMHVCIMYVCMYVCMYNLQMDIHRTTSTGLDTLYIQYASYIHTYTDHITRDRYLLEMAVHRLTTYIDKIYI